MQTGPGSLTSNRSSRKGKWKTRDKKYLKQIRQNLYKPKDINLQIARVYWVPSKINYKELYQDIVTWNFTTIELNKTLQSFSIKALESRRSLSNAFQNVKENDLQHRML